MSKSKDNLPEPLSKKILKEFYQDLEDIENSSATSPNTQTTEQDDEVRHGALDTNTNFDQGPPKESQGISVDRFAETWASSNFFKKLWNKITRNKD